MTFATKVRAMEIEPTIRDVADFYSRWREFRPMMRAALQQGALQGAQAETLAWMIELIDRIDPRDFGSDAITAPQA